MFLQKTQESLAGFRSRDPDPDVPELLQAGEEWAPPTRPIPDHSHDHEWECYLQVAGQSRWRGDGRIHALTAGSAYLAAPRTRHGLVTGATGKHHFIYVIFDARPVLARHPGLTLGPGFQVGPGEALQEPLRGLIRQVLVDVPHRTHGLRCALDHLVVCLAQLGAVHHRAPITDPAIARILDLVRSDPGRDWPLADLARMAGLSVNHLLRRFRAETGQSPHRWVRDERLRRAAQTLRATDVAITTIAMELGFASSQHFATAFKQAHGCSPSAWRRAQSA